MTVVMVLWLRFLKWIWQEISFLLRGPLSLGCCRFADYSHGHGDSHFCVLIKPRFLFLLGTQLDLISQPPLQSGGVMWLNQDQRDMGRSAAYSSSAITAQAADQMQRTLEAWGTAEPLNQGSVNFSLLWTLLATSLNLWAPSQSSIFKHLK